MYGRFVLECHVRVDGIRRPIICILTTIQQLTNIDYIIILQLLSHLFNLIILFKYSTNHLCLISL